MTIISYSVSAVHVDEIGCLAGNNSPFDPNYFKISIMSNVHNQVNSDSSPHNEESSRQQVLG
jgi:hypothetical protein